MAKKKNHLKKSEIDKVFSDIEPHVEFSRKNPNYDGLHVIETDGGFEVSHSERGMSSEKRFFKTRKEVEAYLSKLRKNN